MAAKQNWITQLLQKDGRSSTVSQERVQPAPAPVRARINERFLTNTLINISSHNRREEEADCWRQHSLQQRPFVKNANSSSSGLVRSQQSSTSSTSCVPTLADKDANMREYWAKKKEAERVGASGTDMSAVVGMVAETRKGGIDRVVSLSGGDVESGECTSSDDGCYSAADGESSDASRSTDRGHGTRRRNSAESAGHIKRKGERQHARKRSRDRKEHRKSKSRRSDDDKHKRKRSRDHHTHSKKKQRDH